MFQLKCFNQAEIFQELPWEGCYDLLCFNRKYSMLEINSALLGKPGRYKITKFGPFCSKQETQINNPDYQPRILYSGLHSLNKSIIKLKLNVTKMPRCVLPVTKRLPQIRYFIFCFPWGGITHNPPTQPKHSAPFPCTHEAIYCFFAVIQLFLPDNFRAISDHLDINRVIAVGVGYQVDFWKFCLWRKDSHQSVWFILPWFS